MKAIGPAMGGKARTRMKDTLMRRRGTLAKRKRRTGDPLGGGRALD
jgi:hypothetical protein